MNSLVTKENALATAQDDWGGLLGGTTSLTIRCDLGQPMSQGGKEMGKFNFSHPDWKPQETLTNVVICQPMRTRVLFGKGLNDPRRCGSEDFIRPSPFILNPVSELCANCALSKWDTELLPEDLAVKRGMEVELGKKQAPQPLCNETVNLIVVDDRKVPYILKFQKTQLKVVVEQLINRIVYKGKRPYQVKFDISSKLGDPKKGKFYEYVFTNFQDIQEAEQKEYLGFFEFFKANGQRLMAENIDAMDKQHEREAQRVDDGSIPF